MLRHYLIVLTLLLIVLGCDQQAAREQTNKSEIDKPESIPATKILSLEEAQLVATETRLTSTPKPDARQVLEAAIAAADADNKALFVYFSADW